MYRFFRATRGNRRMLERIRHSELQQFYSHRHPVAEVSNSSAPTQRAWQPLTVAIS